MVRYNLQIRKIHFPFAIFHFSFVIGSATVTGIPATLTLNEGEQMKNGK